MAVTHPVIVAAGHICLDLIPGITTQKDSLAELLEPGKLLNVGGMVTSTGGAVANTGLALNKLGVPVRLVGKVGDDPFGDVTRSILASHGANLCEDMVVARGAGSSYTIVISPPGIDRVFLHHPGPNDTFCSVDVTEAHLQDAAILHFGYPPLMQRICESDGAELQKIMKRARAAGVATSLDMSMPDPDSASGRADWPAFLQRVLPDVDVFVPSFDEIAFMLEPVLTTGAGAAARTSVDALQNFEPDATSEDPILNYVQVLVRETQKLRTEEVTISPAAEGSQIRAVLPGTGIQTLPPPPGDWHKKIVARLKNLANLDLLNRRTTQEGEAVLNIEGRRVRVEVTTRPVDGGEAADLRFEASAQHYDDESAGTTVQLAAISDWLIRAGCAIVALKLGDQGLYLRTTEDAARLKQLGIIPENRVSTWLGRELISPCFRVSVAGTTGSGDATIAGLLAGLQQEAGPVECITLATAVGACNVEAADAVSGIVHRDEVMKRILSGWARNSMRIDLPGWHWLDHHKVWIGPGDLHL